MIRETFREFLDDDAPRLAAALAYYTVFALPGILVLVLLMAALLLDPAEVERALQEQFAELTGPGVAAEIRSIMENVERPGSGGVIATIVGIGALLFGATGAFAQLQAALNKAWEVEPEEGGLKGFFMKRLVSLAMILGVGTLLLASVLLSAVLLGVGSEVAGWLPWGVGEFGLRMLDLGISLALILVLFAAIYKYVPDAQIAWKDVWIGAGVAAALFVAGKFLLGFYIGRSSPGSAYGAAGTLIVLLLWIYVSGMILFLGAEFAQVWARRKGRRIQPEPGAVRVVKGREPSASPGASG